MGPLDLAIDINGKRSVLDSILQASETGKFILPICVRRVQVDANKGFKSGTL
jgi:hypothetical protein